jgi:hypothetical protein
VRREVQARGDAMADIVELHGRSAPTKDDLEFISDMARFSESILTETAIRKKYRMFDDTVWHRSGDRSRIGPQDQGRQRKKGKSAATSGSRAGCGGSHYAE